MDEFQVVDSLEISIFDADDLLPDGTAWFGFSFCAWFRCPSCATAAFLLWVQLSRCTASFAASSRGNSCRVSGGGMIVAMFRWFATLFLALLGSPEGPFIEMHCVLAWFGLLARGLLVTSDGSFYFGPESASLGLSVDDVPCLYTQDPVAQCFNSSLCVAFLVSVSILSCSRLGRVSDFVSLEFSTHFDCCTDPCLVESETHLHM